MKFRQWPLTSALLVGLLGVTVPESVDSCAIGPPEPVFTTRQRPADLHRAYVDGNPGVLWPSYMTTHLIAAYRVLNGVRFTDAEVNAMFQPRVTDDTSRAGFDWDSARNAVIGKPAAPAFRSQYKSEDKDGRFLYYLNCQDESFRTALETLHQRSEKWGSDSSNLKEWVQGQKQVFSNCSAKDAVIPAELPATADALLAADRKYQIAAAYFYAGDLTKAREGFEQIAKDSGSPWKNIAPYLVARCYIREASLDGKAESLQSAKVKLQDLLKDPARKNLNDAVKKLLDYVQVQMDPVPKLKELAQKVANPDAVSEFVYLYHSIREDTKKAADIAATDDLADWLLTMERPSGSQHAEERWRASHQPAWLIAALLRGASDDDLLQAARAYLPSAAGYESVAYYGMLHSRADVERSWAADVLKQNITLSTRNLVRAESMRLAQTWNEFLEFAPRLPEPGFHNFDSREEEADPKDAFSAKAMFDYDAVTAFNQQLPLRRWAEAATAEEIPEQLQIEIAQAAWVRAVLLNQDDVARTQMERIGRLKPDSSVVVKQYLEAGTAEERGYVALFFLLRQPEVVPSVAVESQGGRDMNRLSDLGSGRWSFVNGCAPPGARVKHGTLTFLSEAESGLAERECRQLKLNAAAGANWLATRTLYWAKAHPQDPRIPQALHLVVQATRRGVTDKDSASYSKQAFKLLHSRYPNSEWAAKTKYWYNSGRN